MAKMTLNQIATNVKSYVDQATIAGAWQKTTNNLVNLIDKIGKQVTIDGEFNDKLTDMNGDELPFGKTIEEYYIDLTLPSEYAKTAGGKYDYGTEGGKDLEPSLPEVEDVVYSQTMGRKKIKTTVPYNDFERACLGATEASNITGKILERLVNSYTLYTYQVKKQMLGKIGDLCYDAIKASASSKLLRKVEKPTTATNSEAFIQAVKEEVENASFANEGHCLSGALIGATPSMTLYIKKGVMPTIEVKAMAGAFNKEDLAVPAKIVVVDDFGVQGDSTTKANYKNVFAILVDDRMAKLHKGYQATRTQANADGDFVNTVLHSEHTAFISKYTYVCAFSTTNN